MSSLIHKNLIRQISRIGDQSANKLLQKKINPQPKLDIELLRQKISSLKHTAAQNGLISLSAPQIKFKNRIFVILKQPFIKYSQWTGYQHLFSSKKPQQCYDAIINPQLVSYSDFKIKASEQCPSIQALKFKVWIPLVNRMKYIKYIQLYQRKNNPAFKNYQQSLTGFYGRVFDHQYRHLEGILPNLPQISNNQVYLTNDAIIQPQNFQQLKNYKIQLEYFNQQNMEKHMEMEMNKIKQEKTKKDILASNLQGDFTKLPDKIDTKLKQKLTKSYEAIKNLQKSSKPNINQTLGKLNIYKNNPTKQQQKTKKFQKNKTNKK